MPYRRKKLTFAISSSDEFLSSSSNVLVKQATVIGKDPSATGWTKSLRPAGDSTVRDIIAGPAC